MWLSVPWHPNEFCFRVHHSLIRRAEYRRAPRCLSYFTGLWLDLLSGWAKRISWIPLIKTSLFAINRLLRNAESAHFAPTESIDATTSHTLASLASVPLNHQGLRKNSKTVQRVGRTKSCANACYRSPALVLTSY